MSEHQINADIVSFTTDDGVLMLAFGQDQKAGEPAAYLLLQRAQNETEIYLEVNDQINSGYKLIEAMTNEPGRLHLKVKPELRNLGNPEAICVTYASTDTNLESVAEGVKRIMENGN